MDSNNKNEITELKKQLAVRDDRVEWLEKWWPKWIAEALNITEEEMGRSPLMAHGKVVQMRTRAEKAEAALADERSARAMDLARLAKAEAADGNAGLRELLANLDAWEANDFAEGTRRAPDWIPRQTYRTEINRLLEAAPEPERDDGPLIEFSVDDFGHSYDDALADAVRELCRREIARGAN